MEDVMALFAYGGQITTNAAKVVSAARDTKTSGDFLTHFHHAQIAFGKIVVKRYPKVIHKSQDGQPMVLQAIQKVFGLALLFAASFIGQGSWLWW